MVPVGLHLSTSILAAAAAAGNWRENDGLAEPCAGGCSGGQHRDGVAWQHHGLGLPGGAFTILCWRGEYVCLIFHKIHSDYFVCRSLAPACCTQCLWGTCRPHACHAQCPGQHQVCLCCARLFMCFELLYKWAGATERCWHDTMQET